MSLIPEGQLLAHHLDMLMHESLITEEVIVERGYRSATKAVDLRRLGFADPQCRVPALVLPILNVHGEATRARSTTGRARRGGTNACQIDSGLADGTLKGDKRIGFVAFVPSNVVPTVALLKEGLLLGQATTIRQWCRSLSARGGCRFFWSLAPA